MTTKFITLRDALAVLLNDIRTRELRRSKLFARSISSPSERLRELVRKATPIQSVRLRNLA